MEIDPEALSRRDLHRLLSGIVAPRPMSWVTSVSTADVVHAARLGVVRSAPDRRVTNGDSGHLRGRALGGLRRLGAYEIGPWQLHCVDPSVPVEGQLADDRSLLDEGIILYLDLSESPSEGREIA
jgi:aryl-alcohol dehydrogenase-like predicted oxidoreductase